MYSLVARNSILTRTALSTSATSPSARASPARGRRTTDEVNRRPPLWNSYEALSAKWSIAKRYKECTLSLRNPRSPSWVDQNGRIIFSKGIDVFCKKSAWFNKCVCVYKEIYVWWTFFCKIIESCISNSPCVHVAPRNDVREQSQLKEWAVAWAASSKFVLEFLGLFESFSWQMPPWAHGFAEHPSSPPDCFFFLITHIVRRDMHNLYLALLFQCTLTLGK